MRRITTPTSYVGISVLFLLWSLVCNAQLHPENRDSDVISLRSQTSIFMAGSKAYSLEEIRELNNAEFVPLTTLKENLGFSNEHYWLQFTLDNPSETFANYYLETARPITDVVELFLVDENGNVKKQSSGDQIPFAKKSVQHRKSIFDMRTIFFK